MHPAHNMPPAGIAAQADNHSDDGAMAALPALPLVELITSLRILIVEDDAMIGWLLGDMLELMGHKVSAIETTEDGAVAAAARYTPDMMIVDAQLRVGSGLAAVERILRDRFVPHVFVTGDLRGVRKLRPSAVVIAKPFTEAGLVEAMKSAREAARS